MSLHKCAKFAVLRHTSCADFENGSFYDLFCYVSQLEYLNGTNRVKRGKYFIRVIALTITKKFNSYMLGNIARILSSAFFSQN